MGYAGTHPDRIKYRCDDRNCAGAYCYIYRRGRWTTAYKRSHKTGCAAAGEEKSDRTPKQELKDIGATPGGKAYLDAVAQSAGE